MIVRVLNFWNKKVSETFFPIYHQCQKLCFGRPVIFRGFIDDGFGINSGVHEALAYRID